MNIKKYYTTTGLTAYIEALLCEKSEKTNYFHEFKLNAGSILSYNKNYRDISIFSQILSKSADLDN